MTELLERLQAALGGAYRLERELGGGGMSRVFLATETALGRQVVVKTLPPDLAAGVSVERFRREILLAASLQHPHIVPLLAAGEADGLLYFTMPYVEGENLRVRIERGGPLATPEAVRILRDVTAALAYAHRRGVVHRDIKPENVLLTDQHAVVTDFGVAKALGQSAAAGTLTSAGIALGTPMYMAPEQAAGDPNVDHRCDIYAAGALGYELLTGHAPFQGDSPHRVIAALLTEPPRPLLDVRPDVPPALAAAVMKSLEKEPAARYQSADELLATLEAAISGTTGAAAPARRRRVSVPLLAAGLVLVAAAAALLVFGPAHRRTTGAGNLVAVLPFAVRGGPELAYLGPGMVNLLSTSLDGAGDLRSVDPRAVLTLFPPTGAPALDPAAGSAAARRLGAGRFILGDIVQGGRSVQVSAAMYDPARPAAPVSEGAVEGDAGSVFTLVDDLAAKLLAGTRPGASARVTRIAAVTTASLPALKDWLVGEAALRRGEADSALVAFQAAVAADTGFALAYYRLSIAAEWATRAALAEQAAGEAVKRSARLAEHDRLLLQALEATRRGAADDAARQFREILSDWPDDVEAWNQLGEDLFHYAPLAGRSPIGSRTAWEKVLYFDPDNEGAMLHLARVAAMEHHTAETDSLVARLRTVSPKSDRDLEMAALRAWVDGDRAAQARVLAQLRSAPDPMVAITDWDIAMFAGSITGGVDLARPLTDPSRSPDGQAVGHLVLAYLDVTQGQVDSCRREVAQASATDSVLGMEFGTYLDLLPMVPAPDAVLQRDRARLEVLDAAAIPPNAAQTVYFSAHNGLHVAIRAYLLGLLSARLGDRAAAERYAAELDAQRGPAIAHALPQDYALEVRAEVMRRGGNPARAAELLAKRVGEVWYEYPFASPLLSGMRGRFLRAELAERSGDPRSALDLYGGFDEVSVYDLAFAPWARLGRARLHERLGEKAEAAADYRAVLNAWKAPDPELRPFADSARAGLARLQ